MANELNHNIAAIIRHEQRDVTAWHKLSMRERGDLMAAACRSAAEIEASRLKMGLRPAQPAPWPESTWQFLAEAAQRARSR